MPHKSDSHRISSGHKHKLRFRSPKRRKPGSRRKNSVSKQNGAPSELQASAPSIDDPAMTNTHAHLHITGSDATKTRDNAVIPDASILVSPGSYKQFARRDLVTHKDVMRDINEKLSVNNKLHLNDGNSACSVTSYTRACIEDICQDDQPDGHHGNPSSPVHSSSASSDGIEAFILPKDEQVSVFDTVDSGSVSLGVTVSITEPSASVVVVPDSSTAQPCPEDAGSDLLSTDDSEFGAESRQKTLDWLQSTNQEGSSAVDTWWERETLDERRAKERETFRQTNKIMLHIPQVPQDRITPRQPSLQKSPEDAKNLSVIITNSARKTDTILKTESLDLSISKLLGHSLSHTSLNTSGQNVGQGPQSARPVSAYEPREVQPASARARASARHAELQAQSEQLLKRKQEMMVRQRLQRWLPQTPDTIDVDDLIVINTIRKEMQQNPVQQTVTANTVNGHPGPHVATNYDVDSEHKYIMDRALRSYREHRAREVPPSRATRQHTTPSGQHPATNGQHQEQTETLSVPQPTISAHGQGRPRAQSARISRPTLHVHAPSLSTADPGEANPSHPYTPAGLTASPNLNNQPSSTSPPSAHTGSTSPSLGPNKPTSPTPGFALHANNIDINIHPEQISQSPRRPATAQGRLQGKLGMNRQSSVGSTGEPRAGAQSHVSQGVPIQNTVQKGDVRTQVKQHQVRQGREVRQTTTRNMDKAPRRILQRSQVLHSMDKSRLGKGNDPKRPGLGHGQSHTHHVHFSPSAGVATRRHPFSIHPEWVSENFSVQSINIKTRMNDSAAATVGTDVSERRCKSAPPRTRNPITWENPDVNEICVRDINISLRAGRGRTKKRPKSEAMDAIGNDSEKPKGPKFNIKGTFFTTTKSPRKQYFTIHPEWQSESGQTHKLTTTYVARSMTFPPRRCKSAPPPRTRNPITWTNADRPDKR